MDGVFLSIGSGALGAICTLLGAWIKARYSKTTSIPDPMRVEESPAYEGKKTCQNERRAIHARLSTLEQKVAKLEGEIPHINQALLRIENKLDAVIMRGHP